MSYPIKIEGKENLVIINKEGEQTYLDLPTLTSYKGCITTEYKLKDGVFNFNISGIVDGTRMFYRDEKIKTFTSDLPNLTYGDSMFRYCQTLITFNSVLPALTDSSNMFQESSLRIFNSTLFNLTNSNRMFYRCYNLRTFNSDLSNLTYGDDMFYSTKLISFNSALLALTNGYDMFYNCKLPASEINKILASLPTWTDGKVHTISFTGCPGASTCDTSIAISKGWTVQV